MIDKGLPEMPCQELVDLVTDYVEDRLSPTDRARFEAYLAACAACGTYLDGRHTHGPTEVGAGSTISMGSTRIQIVRT